MTTQKLANRFFYSLLAILALTLGACGGGGEPLSDTASATLAEVAPRPLEGTVEATSHPTDAAAPVEVESVDLADTESRLKARELELWERELEAREAAIIRGESRRVATPSVVEQRPTPAPQPRYEPAPAYEPSPAVYEPEASFEPAPAPERWEEPAPVRRRAVTVPASQSLEVELLRGASTATSQIGDAVTARVSRDVYAGGELAIPAGTSVYGQVTDVKSLRRIGGKARLAVEFTELELPDGPFVPISASWMAEGRGETKRDAATIAGSAVGGAILGKVLDGDDEATAIGAAVGAAVGTAVAVKTKGQEVELPAGHSFELTLDGPVTIAGY